MTETPSNKGVCQVEECSRFGLSPVLLDAGSPPFSILTSTKRPKTLDENQDITFISCVHVESCLLATSKLKEAQPLTVKHSVLNAMSISADWKHTIWLRARKNGPLAQRVSHTTV